MRRFQPRVGSTGTSYAKERACPGRPWLRGPREALASIMLLRLIAHPAGRVLGRTWRRLRKETPPSRPSAPVRKPGASCHEPLSSHQDLAADLLRKLLSGEVPLVDPVPT